MSRIVYVLNDPNLNLLGKRQPHIYGLETLSDVERDCQATAAELNLELRFRQSNREYEIIDWIHEAREIAGGLVINPAAFTHTSVAILDALNAFPLSRCISLTSTSGRHSDTALMCPCAPTQ
jgi:3-dehydroquinate dehydratase-2